MLIGRKTELDRLRALIEATEDGSSAAVLVVGEAGIGKSALLDAAIQIAADRGATVLRARGVEAETDIAFAGLSELVSPVLDLRDRIPAPRAAALGGALALEPSKGQEPFAVAAALVSLLDAAADESSGGVIVAVEDAHWLDQSSLEAVLFAARRLHAAGVVVILTARPEPDRGLRRRGLEEIELSGLSADEAGELLRNSEGDALGEGPLRRLVDAARGNPLALVELPRSLSAAQLAGSAPLPEPVRPSSAIEDAFRGELELLPGQARDGLMVLAADESLDAAVVMSALEKRGLPRSAIEPAEHARLVRVEGNGLRFRHPLLRAVVYHSASFGERQAAHTALAEALRERGENQRRAWHMAAAATEPDAGVAAALELAGDDARGRGAPSSAAHALARAAELTPDDGERARRMLKAARDYATTQPQQAVAVAERALALTNDPLLRADLQRVRGTVAMRAGKPAFGYELMTTEAELVAPHDRLRAAEMLLGSSIADRLMGEHGRMRRTAERAMQLAGTDHPVIQGLSELVVAHMLVLTGRRGEGDELIARNEELLMTADPRLVPWEVIAAPAHLSVWIGNYDRAERILSRLIGRARERNAVTGLIYPLAVRAQLGLRRGRLGPAAVDGDEALKLAVDTEQAGLVAFAGGILAEVEAALGREDDARAHAEEALVTWDAAGAEIMGMYGRVALGLLALGQGRPDEAIAPLEWCWRTAQRLEIEEPGVFQWAPNLIEAYTRMGRTDEAEELLGWLDRAADFTGGTWAIASAARCRGLLAPDDEFDPHFTRSIELLDRLDAAFESARSRLVWGERLRRARRRGDAREPLRAALETFERVGARDWAQRARDELRATGQRVARGKTAVSEELTSHELRVAMLVARGRTNPEVAAELFVSRKTVEYHLSQVYRKLGLRSRTELAAALASELTDELDESPTG